MEEPKRIEMNSGEYFLVAPNTLLVDEWESLFTVTSKIGEPGQQPAYMATFTGRINNTDDEKASYTIAMSVEDAWQFCDTLLRQFEDAMKRAHEE